MNVSVDNFNVEVPGKKLLINASLALAKGHRYGLMGKNGIGKTTLLHHISERTLPIPETVDILHVEQEVKASDETVFNTVFKSNKLHYELSIQMADLEAKMAEEDAPDDIMEQYDKVVEQYENENVGRDVGTIGKILNGLGFNHEQQQYPTKSFSGGWRMRISLATALFIAPTLLILDEPTNHLDLNAVIWLQDYLSKWKKILLVVSHDSSFLNDVCTDFLHIDHQRLRHFACGYDRFQKTLADERKNHEKEYKKIEKEVVALRNRKKNRPNKEGIKKFREEKESKLVALYGCARPEKPYSVHMQFKEVGDVPRPVIRVDKASFHYSGKDELFKDLEFGIDMDSRITLVGANGIGKSTLLKMLAGKLTPTRGEVLQNHRARVAYYHQHSGEVLPGDVTATDYIASLDSSELDDKEKEKEAHKLLGTIGIDGKSHKVPIESLSGGQKARVAFISLFVQKPHVVLLDEPTNHLDMQTTKALCDAINSFQGGVVVVTHSVDLILSTNCILYEVGEGTISKTTYEEYRDKILEEIEE